MSYSHHIAVADDPPAYARRRWAWDQHVLRLERRVMAQKPLLVCQECGGHGGYKEIVLPEEGSGPWYECDVCDGVGYLLPRNRGMWLRWKKECKRMDREAGRLEE